MDQKLYLIVGAILLSLCVPTEAASRDFVFQLYKRVRRPTFSLGLFRFLGDHGWNRDYSINHLAGRMLIVPEGRVCELSYWELGDTWICKGEPEITLEDVRRMSTPVLAILDNNGTASIQHFSTGFDLKDEKSVVIPSANTTFAEKADRNNYWHVTDSEGHGGVLLLYAMESSKHDHIATKDFDNVRFHVSATVLKPQPLFKILGHRIGNKWQEVAWSQVAVDAKECCTLKLDKQQLKNNIVELICDKTEDPDLAEKALGLFAFQIGGKLTQVVLAHKMVDELHTASAIMHVDSELKTVDKSIYGVNNPAISCGDGCRIVFSPSVAAFLKDQDAIEVLSTNTADTIKRTSTGAIIPNSTLSFKRNLVNALDSVAKGNTKSSSINTHLPDNKNKDTSVDKKDEGGSVDKANSVDAGNVVKATSVDAGNVDEADSVDAGNVDKANSVDAGNVVKATSVDAGNVDKANSVDAGNVDKASSVDAGSVVKATSVDAGSVVKATSVDAGNVVKADSVDAGNVDEANSVDAGNVVKATSVDADNVDEANSVDAGNVDKANSVDAGNVDKADSVDAGNVYEANSVDAGNVYEANSVDAGNVDEATSVDNEYTSFDDTDEDVDGSAESIDSEFLPGADTTVQSKASESDIHKHDF